MHNLCKQTCTVIIKCTKPCNTAQSGILSSQSFPVKRTRSTKERNLPFLHRRADIPNPRQILKSCSGATPLSGSPSADHKCTRTNRIRTFHKLISFDTIKVAFFNFAGVLQWIQENY